MSIVKTYSGNIKTTTTAQINNGYGNTTKIYKNIDRTNMFNNAIVEFLTECGVDVKYENDLCWINNFPVLFVFAGSNLFCSVSFPFASGSTYDYNSANTSGNTQFDSSGNYKFKLAFDGNPNGSFILRISNNYTNPTFYSSAIIYFFKTKDRLANKEVFGTSITSRVASNTNANLYLKVFGKDSDGKPVDIYDRTKNRTVTKLLLTESVDFSANSGKLPLMNDYSGVFVLEDVYCYPTNSGLEGTTDANNDSMVEVQIGNKKYVSDILNKISPGYSGFGYFELPNS